MGAIAEIRENWSRLGWWRSQVRKRTESVLIDRPFSWYLHRKYEPPVDHFDADWDNLILLDACRYDDFKRQAELEGALSWRISPASATYSWLNRVVGDRILHDTVYVSGNPRVKRYEDQFHSVKHVWQSGWDPDLKVATPESVYEAAIEAHEQFPSKRLVVHFMQPHQPFIGETGREELIIGTGDERGRTRALGGEVADREWKTPWALLEEGTVERATVRNAYRENLDLVLPYVEDLVNNFEGRTVVSSDHGEMFGEMGWPVPKRATGHPGRIPALNLRKIPWVVVEGDTRKEIVPERPEEVSGPDDSEVRQRLVELGYLEE